jgi:exodeoxyribonuclease V beta subunit
MKPLDIASLELSGLNLIEASAGTGKTWTIAALYILLLLEKELRPEQILVVTYTKAATAELRERIRRRIADTLDLYAGRRAASDDTLEQLLMTTRVYDSERARQLLTQALYSFDDAAIFTIHGFCQRALLENAFESGSLFGSDMISDQSALVKQVCDDFWRSRILSQPEEFIEHLTVKGYTPEQLARPLEGHFQNPALVIIPAGEETEIEPLMTLREKLYSQICPLWNSERGIITGQLDQAKLNQQSYKPAQINAAADALDLWAAGGKAAAATVCNLDLFSINKIIAKLTKSSTFTPDHHFFSLCQQMVETQDSLNQAFQNRIIACQHELKLWFERELAKRKSELNQRSFDDLLLDLHAALEAKSGPLLAEKLRQRYRAAMIDEFQDTDPLQWNIFHHIGAAPGYPLFLIGDPKQAIYSFRGADVFAYLNAARTAPPEQTQTLTTNFRSDKFLIHAVNTLFAATDSFRNAEIPFHPVESGRSEQDLLLLDGDRDESPFKLWIYPRRGEAKSDPKPVATRIIVQAVATEIALLLEPGRSVISSSDKARPLRPNDIAVLVKSHKQADQIQEALKNRSIPSVQLGSGTIFESSEALDLLRILRAAAEPHREALVREALLTATMGVSANKISHYVECAGEHPEWESWLQHFLYLHAAAANGGVVAVVSRLLGSCGVRERLLADSGGERCLTNLLHCCEMLHQVEREQDKSLSGLITWLERKISSADKDDAALLRLETDENAVIISTIHASKGLQYPVVFVPFAWDAPSAASGRPLFHDDQGRLILDLAGDESSKKRASEEQKAEATRLLYVALTRAEFRCYAVWGDISGASESLLFHLLKNKLPPAPALDQEIIDAINLMAKDEKCGISAGHLPTDVQAASFREESVPDAPYTSRIQSQPLRDDWRIASFSGITSGAGHGFEPHDHDPLTTIEALPAPPVSGLAPEGMTLFDFPRGAQAGTCLHELFELLDFSRLDGGAVSSATKSALADNGFDETWHPAVRDMVIEVTKAALIPDEPDFSLKQLHRGDWQTEMEFYLPVKQLNPATLQTLFDGVLDKELFRDYYELLNRLTFRQSRGMLQGFIDLVFSWRGRYYILDWKSNHLGMKSNDYNRAAMHESMCRSAYTLQYHLYTLAVDRLLKVRLPGYRYDTHFGGVVYVYLRGVSGEMPMNGIYFDRPSPDFIRRSEELLLD